MSRLVLVVTCALVLGCASAFAAAAQAVQAPLIADATDGNWRGAGRDFGRGYQLREGGRRLEGRGREFGKGWRLGADGIWRGTGENFGRRWAPTNGDWRGAGRDFGRGYQLREGGRRLEGRGRDFGGGWRRGADGIWRGTGKNFGRRWTPGR